MTYWGGRLSEGLRRVLEVIEGSQEHQIKDEEIEAGIFLATYHSPAPSLFASFIV